MLALIIIVPTNTKANVSSIPKLHKTMNTIDIPVFNNNIVKSHGALKYTLNILHNIDI